MSIPEPFTAASLSAGVLTNIASDILKHHAQTLERTLAGRMLKWAGLIEPNFDDRLQDALSKGLGLYFDNHPQYKLTGITAVFRDPAVTQQIGQYILDRKPIDRDKIQQALERHLGSDGITRALIQQRGLKLECIIPDFLACYRRVLSRQLSVPQMAIMLEIVDQTDMVIAEMRASEERLKAIVQQVIGRVGAQIEKLDSIDASLEAIKRHLGLDRPQRVIAREIMAVLDAAPRGAMFEADGSCSEYPLEALPGRYYIAQAFNENRSDLRTAIEGALNQFEVTSVCADDFYWGGPRLCKIIGLIQGTPFGVYQLGVRQDRNVYLELGIAIGLGHPFVLVKDSKAVVASLARGLEYYSIDSYLETRYQLGDLLKKYITNVGSYRPKMLPIAGSQKTAVLAHGQMETIDFCTTMAKQLNQFGYEPIVIIGKFNDKLARVLSREEIPYLFSRVLDEIVMAVQTARLGVYRIDQQSDPDTFVVLGIAIGLNRPSLLVYNERNPIPSDLFGLDMLGFRGFTELERTFKQRFNRTLVRYSS